LDPFRSGSFNRSVSSEADRCVYRLMRVKPLAAAPWRGLGALALVERAQMKATSADPHGGEAGDTAP